MSKFAAYYEWTVTARKCLDGELPPPHLGEFRLPKRWIHFPLAGLEHSTRVARFYQELLDEVERSRLHEKRKELYRKFQNRVVFAHIAHEEIQVVLGTASRLRTSLAHLHVALKLMKELKEYDDEHPVHWSEVFPTQSAQGNLSPEELWFLFKLESLRPCLVALVRLLRQVLPDCSVLWNECEGNLLRREWIFQFILDLPKPLETQVPAHFLRIFDVPLE
ncbi:hypothetical protein F4818DRAFT_425369 [Hypoxylon cercidicola]|nr:hypothetical protein F4818DRAFT_425369 [Hypoxylon cercidicola]